MAELGSMHMLITRSAYSLFDDKWIVVNSEALMGHPAVYQKV